MGWSINELDNTVVVPQEFAQKLFEADEDNEVFYSVADVLDEDGRLSFNSDHMEWMDYVWREEILAVLAEAKVNGRIVFSDTEGDDKGTWWSYNFVDGVCEKKGGKLSDLIPG